MFVRIQSLLVAIAATASVKAAYTPTACNENGTVAGDAQSGVCSRGLLDTILADVTELLFARELGATNTTLTEHEIEPRIVYSPKITSPGATTVWVAGQMATVTWSVP